MTQGEIPETEVQQVRRPFWQRISYVWLIPVAALLVSLGVAWNAYSSRGELIEITFKNGSGVEAGTTLVKFRDVAVGKVESISFTPDLSEVVVSARMDKVVAPYLDADAEFWVVRPTVSVRQVTGLSTVLSGVYIEGNWDNKAGTAKTAFVGDEAPPLVRAGQKGTWFTLEAPNGNSLAEGAPILHKGIPVGYIEKPVLTPDGQGVSVRAFVEAPYDSKVSEATRFWDTSGFSMSLGPSGLSLNVTSLASLVEGGIGFDTLVAGSGPPRPDQIFTIFPDEDTARQSLFSTDSQNDVMLSIVLSGSASGLAPGADVKLRGITVGKVVNVNAIIDPGDGGPKKKPTVLVLANISLNPGKLGMGEDATKDETLDFLADYVAQGLRARLTTGSILTGALVVELVEVPDAPPAELDRTALPYPVLPSVKAQISDFSASAEGVLDRINKLPIEDLLNSAITLIDDIDVIVASEDTRKVPTSAVALLDEARTLIGSDEVKGIPVAIGAAADDVRGIVGDLRDAQAVEKLVTAIDQAGKAAAAIDTATQGLPEIMSGIEDLTRKANALKIEDLIASATGLTQKIDAIAADPATVGLPGDVSRLLQDARTLVLSPDVQAIPADLRATTGDLRGIVADIRAAQTVEKLAAAIDTAGKAIAKIDAATDNLPEIMSGIQDLTTKANALQVETLIASATRLSDNLDAIASDDAMRQLPASVSGLVDQGRTLLAQPDLVALPADLRATVTDLRQVITDLRDAQTVENLADAIQRAGEAAAKIDDAATGLPALVDQVKALSEKANSLDVETLIASATRLTDSVDDLVGTDAARQLPASLNDTLAEVKGLLAEIREGGAVQNVNSALNSAKSAADAVETAASSLPDLADRINALVKRAETVINAYGDGSKLNSEAISTLRGIQSAANSISTLARTIQRNPNSLLMGR